MDGTRTGKPISWVEMPDPHVVVIGGANGAGKSTAAPFLLPEALGIAEFVNADTIARGLCAFAPETVAVEAGKLMLGRVRALARERANFAFETTMASRSFAPWLGGLRQEGYSVHLAYLWIESPGAARARVEERVSLGGHDIPDDVVERRYRAGMRNFWGLYRKACSTWRVYHSSSTDGLVLVAHGQGEGLDGIEAPEIWARLQGGLGNE